MPSYIYRYKNLLKVYVLFQLGFRVGGTLENRASLGLCDYWI